MIEYYVYALMGLVFVGGVIQFIRNKLAQRAYKPMSEWKCIGANPPEGLDVALDVIKEHLSWVPPDKATYGGVIEWAPEPYYIYNTKVAGSLENDRVPHVKVVVFPYIWQTALAHEILHIYWIRCYGRSGDGEGDFYMMVGQINKAIKARLAP